MWTFALEHVNEDRRNVTVLVKFYLNQTKGEPPKVFENNDKLNSGALLKVLNI